MAATAGASLSEQQKARRTAYNKAYKEARMAEGRCTRCGDPKEPDRFRKQVCLKCRETQYEKVKLKQQDQAARAAELVAERIASDPRLPVRSCVAVDHARSLRDCVRCGLPATFECPRCEHAFCEPDGCWLDGHPNKHMCIRR